MSGSDSDIYHTLHFGRSELGEDCLLVYARASFLPDQKCKQGISIGPRRRAERTARWKCDQNKTDAFLLLSGKSMHKLSLSSERRENCSPFFLPLYDLFFLRLMCCFLCHAAIGFLRHMSAEIVIRFTSGATILLMCTFRPQFCGVSLVSFL